MTIGTYLHRSTQGTINRKKTHINTRHLDQGGKNRRREKYSYKWVLCFLTAFCCIFLMYLEDFQLFLNV